MEKTHWVTIIAGIAGISLGVYFNKLNTKKSNEQLLADIKAEIDSLKARQQTARSTPNPADANRLNQLEGALAILESKMR